MKLMKTPKSVEIEVTNKCNLRCKHCYHFSSASDVDKDLPTAEWLDFFEELSRCAVLDITLCGPLGQGEATIKIAQSATQVFQKYWWKLDDGKKCILRKKIFANSCELAKKIPVYLLHVSLDGKFWEEIEKALY